MNLVKSGIPANEVLCSLADAIVLQNLSRADPRVDAEAQGAPARRARTPTCPSSRSAGACASPQTWDERGYAWPKDRPIEETIFVPENAQYYAAFGACVYGLKEAATVGALRRQGRPRRVHDERPQGAPRRERGPAARQDARTRSTTFKELYAIPRFIADEARAGAGGARRHRPRRRLDVEQGRAHRRGRRDRLQGLPALEGQPHPGREGAPRPAPRLRGRARARRSRSSASAPPATRPTCSRRRCAPT